MSLPRFLDRVVDATAPLLGGLDRDAVRSKLANTSVTLVAGERAASSPSHNGFLLVANLLARLYPRIDLQAPAELAAAAADTITSINPAVEIGGDGPTTATLAYETLVHDNDVAAVCARGWNVYVDQTPDYDDDPSAAAALLAAVVGVGELFRIVFAAELGGRGRHGHQPGAWNLVTLGEPAFGLPVPEVIDLSRFRLVGAGAIGQAAANTLAVSGARGTMVVVDPETIALSNLQRYVLAGDADIDAAKAELLQQRLAGSALEVEPVPSEWHAGLVDGQLATLVVPRLARGAHRRPGQPPRPCLQRLDTAGRRRLVTSRALRRRTLSGLSLLARPRDSQPPRADRPRLWPASAARPGLPRPSRHPDRLAAPARRHSRAARHRSAA